MTTFRRISSPPPQKSFSIIPTCYRLLCTPFSTAAAFYRCRNLSTPFSIDAVKFLPTPFVFYRHRFPSITYPIDVAFDSYRFLPLPQPVNAVSIDAAFYRCCYYRQRFLSTLFSIDTARYRHHLLSTPLAIDTACYRHRLLPPPFSIAVLLPQFSMAIATTAILREVALCHD
jgi:hypothetical protein